MNLKSGKNLIQTVLFFLFLRFTYFYHGRHIYREKKRDRWLQVSILNYLLNCLFNSCGKSDGGREMDTHTHRKKRKREREDYWVTAQMLPTARARWGKSQDLGNAQQVAGAWALGPLLPSLQEAGSEAQQLGLEPAPQYGTPPFL